MYRLNNRASFAISRLTLCHQCHVSEPLYNVYICQFQGEYDKRRGGDVPEVYAGRRGRGGESQRDAVHVVSDGMRQRLFPPRRLWRGSQEIPRSRSRE